MKFFFIVQAPEYIQNMINLHLGAHACQYVHKHIKNHSEKWKNKYFEGLDHQQTVRK